LLRAFVRRLVDRRGQAEWVEFSLQLMLFLFLGTAAWAVFIAGRDQLILNHAASMTLSSERVYGCYTNVADQDLKDYFSSQGLPPQDIQVQASPTSVQAAWGMPVAVAIRADVAMPVFAWSGWSLEIGTSGADVAQPVTQQPAGANLAPGSTTPVYCQSPTMNATVNPGTTPSSAPFA
jgi:hypothetical protein